MRISDWSSDVCSSDLVAKNLDFDVTCLAYESFEINCAVREAFCGKVLGCLYRGYKIFRLIHVAHADAATAASRFDQQGVADRRPNIRQTHIVGLGDTLAAGQNKIGRASCRERGCKYV